MPGPIAGRFEVISSASREVNISFDGDEGNISVGGSGQNGEILVKNKDGEVLIRIDAETGRITVGGKGQDGELSVKDKEGKTRIHLDGGESKIFVGDKGAGGEIILKDDEGKIVVRLGAGVGRLRAYNEYGHEFFCVLDNGSIRLGGNSTDGKLLLFDKSGSKSIRLEGSQANMWLGGNGRDGDIFLFKNAGDNETSSEATIHLNGEKGDMSLKGDIHLQGADCAEKFTVRNADSIEPGTVLVIDTNGDLRASDQAYDKKVAGVVSGAGKFRPGIILNDHKDQTNSFPIALNGKVYCKVNVEAGPIEVGDLLTTSSLPGYAMKAENPTRSFGAVIGKALEPLENVSGLIPILVALQ